MIAGQWTTIKGKVTQAPIDGWVVLVEPIISNDNISFPSVGDGKGENFGMICNLKVQSGNSSNRASFNM